MTKQLAVADLHKFLLGFDRFMEPNTCLLYTSDAADE